MCLNFTSPQVFSGVFCSQAQWVCFVQQVCVQDFDVTRTLQLLNSSEMIVHFKLKTQPPFMVIKPNPRVRSSTSSNSRSAESEFLVLQQQKSVQVQQSQTQRKKHKGSLLYGYTAQEIWGYWL